MEKKENAFFMVFVESGNTPAFKHPTLEDAEREAKRLAESTGKKAYVLCSMKSFEMSKFTVRDCRPFDDGLPF